MGRSAQAGQGWQQQRSCSASSVNSDGIVGDYKGIRCTRGFWRNDDPGRVLRVEVKIPERLTEGRDHVRVTFRPLQQGGSMGAIFDVRTLRDAEPSVAHP